MDFASHLHNKKDGFCTFLRFMCFYRTISYAFYTISTCIAVQWFSFKLAVCDEFILSQILEGGTCLVFVCWRLACACSVVSCAAFFHSVHGRQLICWPPIRSGHHSVSLAVTGIHCCCFCHGAASRQCFCGVTWFYFSFCDGYPVNWSHVLSTDNAGYQRVFAYLYNRKHSVFSWL